MEFTKHKGFCFICTVLCVFVVTTLVFNSTKSHYVDRSIMQKDIMKQAHSVLQPSFKKRFPTALIIGAKKCGTTALRKILNNHPSIQTVHRELRYFCIGHRRSTFENGIDWYINQMPLTTEKELTIEKSPCYFFYIDAPELVQKISKSVKLLLILRNPLVRTVSEFFYQERYNRTSGLSYNESVLQSNGEINMDTLEVNISMYDVHFENWLKWFPKNQFLIIDGDNLKLNPVEELSRVENFLNISHHFSSDMFSFDHESSSYYLKESRYRSEQKIGLQHTDHDYLKVISNDTLKKVAEFLQPHARKFCEEALVNYIWCTDMYFDSHFKGYL